MTLEFQLWGQLREAANTQAAKLDFPEPVPLESALQTLAAQYPGLQPRILNEDQSVRASILLFQDGQQLAPGALQQPIGEDTAFTLMSPIAGG